MPATEKHRIVRHPAKSGAEAASIPLGKYLASTEKKTRDGAIKSLANFLAQSNREPLNDEEMAKLWKGIFYCESTRCRDKYEGLSFDLFCRLLDVGQTTSAAGIGARARRPAPYYKVALVVYNQLDSTSSPFLRRLL